MHDSWRLEDSVPSGCACVGVPDEDDEGDRHESRTQHHERWVEQTRFGIEKLWEKGEEEDSELRIQEVEQDAPAHDRQGLVRRLRAAFAVNLMLFMGGIGVLKVAPWGRTLSLACGALGVVVYVALIIGNSVSIPYLGMLAYSFLLVGLFFTENWKNTFCSCESVQLTTESAPASSETSESEETREAA